MVSEALEHNPGVAVLSPGRLWNHMEPRGLDPSVSAVRPQARDLALALGADAVVDAVLRRRGRRWILAIASR